MKGGYPKVIEDKGYGGCFSRDSRFACRHNGMIFWSFLSKISPLIHCKFQDAWFVSAVGDESRVL